MADTLSPFRAGLLCNPASGFVRKHPQKIRELIAQMPDVIFRESPDSDGIQTIIDEFNVSGINLLIIIGGDGTVQAVLDHLLSRSDLIKIPYISIIPAGTTNMTAKDIGFRGSPVKVLQKLSRLLTYHTEGKLVKRPALCIEQASRPDIYGMFFGAGIIASGSRFFHQHIKKSGFIGEFTSAIVILHLLTGLLMKRSSAELQPVRILLTDDNGVIHDQVCLILLASTMNRLLLGLRPYWGQQHAPLHTTFITATATRLWRSLLRLIIGRGSDLAEADGYYSRNNHSLEVLMDEGFIVDGEFFRAESQYGPLRITATENIVFLVP
jgi:diacylglycerol kinase (ATP)